MRAGPTEGLPDKLPQLHGFVRATPREGPLVNLPIMSPKVGDDKWPILAHWQYGLGRVVAWTSDAQQGWASDWANWRDAGQFWSQALRWSLPAPVPADFQPTAALGADGRQVVLSVQALGDDGRFADLQDTRATVVSPDGSAREVSLPQHGPGTYTLETGVGLPGVYRVLFSQGVRAEVAGFSVPDAVELHSVGLNRALLDVLARTSGGHELADVGDIARPANGSGPAIDLWPYLLAAALFLLPIDVFIRRRA